MLPVGLCVCVSVVDCVCVYVCVQCMDMDVCVCSVCVRVLTLVHHQTTRGQCFCVLSTAPCFQTRSGDEILLSSPLLSSLLATTALLGRALVGLELDELLGDVVVVALGQDAQHGQARLVHVDALAQRQPARHAAPRRHVFHLQH